MKPKRLGELLLESGAITPEQLAQMLERQLQTGHKLGVLVVEEGYASQEDVSKLLQVQTGFRQVDLANEHIEPEVPKLIREDMARRHHLIPMRIEDDKLLVAMADPTNIVAVDDVRLATRLVVRAVRADKKDILGAIDRHYRDLHTAQAMEDYRQQQQQSATGARARQVAADEAQDVTSAPMVKFVDSLIQQAITLQASDIHIEPFDTDLRVRFRTDGDLREVMATEIASHPAIVTRVKIMGNMDIGERRLPQDGRVNYSLNGHEVDMRVSVLPTAYGEKVAIRLLDRDEGFLSRKQLGFSKENLVTLEHMMRYPYGIILAAGPTGSGKTTTMYVMLDELNRIERNIVTIEDPIEYRIAGVNQTQVNLRAGYTFASGLRSILRQDPDIIMIGEIRDTETAQIAVRAAITGHLVLSTVHTNDAVSTVDRLIDMGVEPFLIASGTIGVIAQRLVKKICTNCKVSYLAQAEDKQLLGRAEDSEVVVYRGEGCPACAGTGYKGRTAIVEMMRFSRAIKREVVGGRDVDRIRQIARDEGMVTMRESAIRLVLEGVTTVEELARSIYTLEQE